MNKATERAEQVECADCGKEYGDSWGLDTTLSNAQWADIAQPNEILCANCIVARASKLAGAVAARMVIEIVPWSPAHAIMLETLEAENKKQAERIGALTKVMRDEASEARFFARTPPPEHVTHESRLEGIANRLDAALAAAEEP